MAARLIRLAVPAALLVFAGCEGGSRDAQVDCPPTFNRAEWRSTEPGPARKRLAREVLQCRFVARLDSRAKVRALLGRPSSRESESREWNYLVGQTNGYLGPPDDQYLFLWFGPTDRVQEISIEP